MGIEQSVVGELHKIESAFSAHFGALSAPAISIDAKEALESLRRIITQIETKAVQTPPAKPAPPKPTEAK